METKNHLPTGLKEASPGREEAWGGFRIFGGTEKGNRPENEDHYAIVRNDALGETLLILCDGMGGYTGGAQASQLAVETIRQTYLAARLSNQETQPALQAAFLAANNAIISQLHRGERTPGSCAVMAVLNDNGELVIANLGDSRAYRIDKNRAEQITTDHSFVQNLIDQGTITEEKRYTHDQRNVITKALGRPETDAPDFFTGTLAPGNQLLLCSDGLWEMTRDPDGQVIQQLVHATKDPKKAVSSCIAKAMEAGGEDNITVIVAKRTELKTPQVITKQVEPRTVQPAPEEEKSGPTAPPPAELPTPRVDQSPAENQVKESEAKKGFIEKAKSFFKNWWKNVSPQGRNKWHWAFGATVGAVEQLILRPLLFPILGPAGGWLISGLNALAIQGINQRIQRGVTEAKANGEADRLAKLMQEHKGFADVAAGIAAGSLGGLIGSAIWEGFVSPESMLTHPAVVPGPAEAVVPGPAEAAAPPIESAVPIEYPVKPGDTLTEILQGMGKDPYGPDLTQTIIRNAEALSAKGPEYASAVREILAHPDWVARGGSNKVWETIMQAARLIHPGDILKI